jgi:uncharacterized protein
VTTVKMPRVVIEIDGKRVRPQDVLEVNVTLTLYMAADTFTVQLNNQNLLSDYLRKNQEISIYMGYVGDAHTWSKGDLVHVFTGKIDAVDPKFDNEMTVRLAGRDYSAPLLDTTFSVAYAERTSSQIAEMLFKKHGLTAQVTPTDDVVSKDMYENKKEWEVLQALADLEGFICYVGKDKNAYFGPRDESDDWIETALYYRVGPSSNCAISFSDSALDCYNQVTVRHYHKKQLIEATAKDDKMIEEVGQVKERVFYVAKATTKAKAQTIADNYLKEVSRYVITGKVSKHAGNPLLECEKKVSVHGCGRFDGNYYVERVEHTYNDRGFSTNLDVTSLRPDEAQQYRQDLYTSNGPTM